MSDTKEIPIKNFDFIVKENLARQLFDHFPEALMLIDSDGTITDVNETCNAWIGYGADELVGLHVSKIPFLTKKGKLKALAQFTKRIGGSEVEPYELEVTDRKKNKKLALIRASIIKDKAGKPLIDFVAVTDITQLKANEQEVLSRTEEIRKLNKLMMGRELKMYELKAAIQAGEYEKIKPKLESTDPWVENYFYQMVGEPFKHTKLNIKTVIKRLFAIILFNTKFQVLLGILLGIIVSFTLSTYLVSGLTAAFISGTFSLLLTFFVLAFLINLQKDVQNRYQDNTINVLLNLLSDLTEEKEYEQIRGKSILENIGESIVITDEEGKITYVNPYFENIFGQTSAELAGLDFAEELEIYDEKGNLLPVYERSDSAAITAKNQQLKGMMNVPNNKKIAVEIHAAPIRVQNQYHGVVRIIHDVTEEYLLNQQKDDFFSIASHELRTPLTVIAGNIDMILQGYGKSKLSKSDTELLGDVSEASERLISMVNDFLNVSRLDQGRIRTDIKEINACEVVESVIKELEPLAKEKGIYLKYACPEKEIRVLADLGLLKEAVINLVGNSIKFTSEGGISVEQSIEKDALVTRIIDTGMGIAEDKQSKLFNRFEQAHERTLSREAGGTGLGLYISKEFIKLMNGDMMLEKSELKKGSTFKFTLPIVKSKESR